MSTLPTSMSSDVSALASLRTQAAQDPKAAIKQAAKQFEALFMRELMKSMREATPTTGLFDNQATRLGTEMLDAQLAEKASGGPGSLSAIIARQLERQMGATVPELAGTAKKAELGRTGLMTYRADSAPRMPEKRAADFLDQHAASAQAAQATTGIPATFMLAQAAHESGWGRREIMRADGTPSNNLFGIKAGPGWQGAVAEVVTTEYVGGQPHKLVQRFRAYADASESFADYARLMKTNPRYQGVMAAGSDAQAFAQGLQRAGYATDPHYAAKLERVIQTARRHQGTST